MSVLSITIQDLILAGAYVLTRRIWLCWGIHWGWNFSQDGLFGMPNSGVDSLPSWINSEIVGPLGITGGQFGIEYSFQGVMLNLLAGIILLSIAIKRKHIVKPFWNRS